MTKNNELKHVVDINLMYISDVSSALKGRNNMSKALIRPEISASHRMERANISAIENSMKLIF